MRSGARWRDGARCDGIQYQPFRAPARAPYGGHGLKLFSLSGRFVRVCKTVAKLLAAHSSWTLEMRCLQNSTGSSDELSSFFIRYATHATISARNRESGFPSRRRRAHHFLTSDGSTDNMTVANVYQVIRMEKNGRRERIPAKKEVCAQSIKSLFRGLYLGSMQQKGVFSAAFRMRQESFLKSALEVRLPFRPPPPESSSPSESGRRYIWSS